MIGHYFGDYGRRRHVNHADVTYAHFSTLRLSAFQKIKTAFMTPA
jgi:hypothetical protein